MKSILEALQYPTPTSWSSLSCAFRPCSLGLEQFRVVKLSLFRTAEQKEKKKKKNLLVFFRKREKQKRAFAVPYFLLYLSHVTNNVDFYQLFVTCEWDKKEISLVWHGSGECVRGCNKAERLATHTSSPPPAALSAVSCAEPLLAEPLSAEAALGEHCR